MSTDIVPFNYGNHTIHSVLRNGEPWWFAKDICRALGYKNPADAVRTHVDREDRDNIVIPDVSTGRPDRVIVNESGMYALIFGSKLSTAKAFKRWITHEVLPEIRRTGEYSLTQLDPDQRELELAERLAAAARERIAIKAELAITAPKAKRLDHLVRTDGGFYLASVARQLGFHKLTRVFNQILIEEGALRRTRSGQLTPTEEWIAKGYMTTRPPAPTAIVTEEGFAYLETVNWDE